MIKITLDTNCIINLFDYQSQSATSVDELSELFLHAMKGDVNLAITTRVENDISKDKNNERKIELIRRIAMFPVIGTVARFGSSKFGSGDFFVGEDHEKLEKELKNLIFPELDKESVHFGNKINDIDHLIGHIHNKRDIFITDDKQILKKSVILKDNYKLLVMKPGDCLEYINLNKNESEN